MKRKVVNRGYKLVLLVAIAALCGCGDEVWKGDLPAPDAASFASQVYPVMLRDCAFNDCHGGPARFLQIFGPGRTRIDPQSMPEDPPTALEISISYQRALSMLVVEAGEPLTEAPLLKKPLERIAGGVAHKGIDAHGRNVYQSKLDPSYVTLVQWAMGGVNAGNAGAGATPGGAGTTAGASAGMGAGAGGAGSGARSAP
jgi:hypothetical protein